MSTKDATMCAKDATVCAKDATMCTKDATMSAKDASKATVSAGGPRPFAAWLRQSGGQEGKSKAPAKCTEFVRLAGRLPRRVPGVCIFAESVLYRASQS